MGKSLNKCVFCGKQIPYHLARNGRVVTYCSNNCIKRAYKARTKPHQPFVIKNCIFCGNTFSTNINKMVCSRKCRKHYDYFKCSENNIENKIIQFCLFCGNKIPRENNTLIYKKYCSRECCLKARKIRNQTKSKYKYSNKMKKCKRCGDVYYKKTYNQIYCSHECKDSATLDRLNKIRILNRNQKKCKNCGNIFIPLNTNKQEHCSTICYKTYHSKITSEKYYLTHSKKDCKYCGKELKIGERKLRKRYCNKNCYMGWAHDTKTIRRIFHKIGIRLNTKLLDMLFEKYKELKNIRKLYLTKRGCRQFRDYRIVMAEASILKQSLTAISNPKIREKLEVQLWELEQKAERSQWWEARLKMLEVKRYLRQRLHPDVSLSQKKASEQVRISQ